ncbi:serine hydrolase [Lactobacillus nasalidis]|uniref:serine hydrolase n=1 Tax=Lactobacillus nasalidis TaxID=2797258 RepID=UPI001915FD21|nr:serine hydrolase [Lactobacillus nasalidis]GHV97949.1 serine hydrolase [Lactobacillus nasalidis]GHV98858.1 serine hydrolase [Lactobacillus nasalidis]
MRNNIVVGALIASLLAFVVYTSTNKDAETRQVTVVQVKKQGTVKKQVSSSDKEPNVNSIEYDNQVKSSKGSNKKLAKAIKKAMGQDVSYQVAAYDLTKTSRFAVVRNTTSSQNSDKIFYLYLLIALYAQEKAGKIGSSTTIKITSADKSGSSSAIAVGISYGPSYLREQMLKGNKTAANALLRTIGAKQVDAVVKKMGASQTKVTGTFSKSVVGKTTAQDLAKVMVALYQGKVVGSYNQQVLTAMTGTTKLASKAKGTIYQYADGNLEVALISNSGHTYVVSAWSSKTDDFASLGQAVKQVLE